MAGKDYAKTSASKDFDAPMALTPMLPYSSQA
jgi:hypothetical protein